MPQRAATLESLPVAIEVVRAMQADQLGWREGLLAVHVLGGHAGLLDRKPRREHPTDGYDEDHERVSSFKTR